MRRAWCAVLAAAAALPCLLTGARAAAEVPALREFRVTGFTMRAVETWSASVRNEPNNAGPSSQDGRAVWSARYRPGPRPVDVDGRVVIHDGLVDGSISVPVTFTNWVEWDRRTAQHPPQHCHDGSVIRRDLTLDIAGFTRRGKVVVAWPDLLLAAPALDCSPWGLRPRVDLWSTDVPLRWVATYPHPFTLGGSGTQRLRLEPGDCTGCIGPSLSGDLHWTGSITLRVVEG